MTAGEPPHLNLMKTSSGEVGADFSWTPHWTFGSLERTHTAGLVPVEGEGRGREGCQSGALLRLCLCLAAAVLACAVAVPTYLECCCLHP